MADDSWKEVRSKLEGLGLKLKLHLEQEQDETDTTSTPGETRKAVDDLGHRIQDAFNSFGAAAKDPAVRADMKEIGALVKDAVLESFHNVGAEVGDRFGKGTDSDAGGDAGADAAGSTTTDPAGDTSEPRTDG